MSFGQFFDSLVSARSNTGKLGRGSLEQGDGGISHTAFEMLTEVEQDRLALANDRLLLRLDPSRQQELLASLSRSGRHARVCSYPILLDALSDRDRKAYVTDSASGLPFLLDHLGDLSEENRDHVLRFVSNPENLGAAASSILAILEAIEERAAQAVRINEMVRCGAALALRNLRPFERSH